MFLILRTEIISSSNHVYGIDIKMCSSCAISGSQLIIRILTMKKPLRKTNMQIKAQIQVLMIIDISRC